MNPYSPPEEVEYKKFNYELGPLFRLVWAICFAFTLFICSHRIYGTTIQVGILLSGTVGFLIFQFSTRHLSGLNTKQSLILTVAIVMLAMISYNKAVSFAARTARLNAAAKRLGEIHETKQTKNGEYDTSQEEQNKDK